jgi:hypothetical protein
MLRTWIVAGWVLAAGMLVQAPAAAQRVDATRIIDLHVNAEANNRSVGGTVAEGQGFRMTFDRVGSFEIVPVVVDEAQGRFRVTVYRGPVNSEVADMRAVETVNARLGVPVALRSMPSVGLVIDAVRRVEAQAAARPAAFSFTAGAPVRITRALMQDRCCVSCGGFVACGCKVSGDCGFCCVNPCCPPPIETSTDRVLPAERSFAGMAGVCGNPIRNEERIHTAPTRAVLAVVSTR